MNFSVIQCFLFFLHVYFTPEDARGCVLADESFVTGFTFDIMASLGGSGARVFINVS